jgi:hypothetical protein
LIGFKSEKAFLSVYLLKNKKLMYKPPGNLQICPKSVLLNFAGKREKTSVLQFVAFTVVQNQTFQTFVDSTVQYTVKGARGKLSFDAQNNK